MFDGFDRLGQGLGQHADLSDVRRFQIKLTEVPRPWPIEIMNVFETAQALQRLRLLSNFPRHARLQRQCVDQALRALEPCRTAKQDRSILQCLAVLMSEAVNGCVCGRKVKHIFLTS
ncbi:hypothetical protein [Antarctobacter jejuensis]|uniref:hypothetical protein n=1 Tax=Antarctobacter jejuensis TaxID=1439938 RepID=UPI003FD39855